MISVCMSTFNGERFLREQIDSILSQLQSGDELVISDDGSTDHTLDIITSYSSDAIRLVHHQKRKQKYPFSYTTSNIKNALKQAKGDIIFLADQDDVWLPNKVEVMLNYCKDYDLVVADCIEVNKDLHPICDSHFQLYHAKIGFWHNFIGPCCYLGANMCFKRKLMDYFMDIPDSVPHDLWIGIIANLKGKMCLAHEKTMLYRRHDSNVSAINNKVFKTISTENRNNIRRNNHSLTFKLKYRLDILYQLFKRLLQH